ncbi:lambda exonuclease family protein [Xanthomonas euvesicatoria]
MTQQSDEWFAARVGKFTASRFSELMAKTKSGPSTMRVNLITDIAVQRITGDRTEGFTSPALQRGVELEQFARSAYETDTGILVAQVDYIAHPEYEFAGASPDGLIGDDGLVEFKCPWAMAKHYDALEFGSHAIEYRWQVMGQMWVTGRTWCDVVSYDPRFPDGLRLAITRVQRDNSMIGDLEAAVVKAEEEVQERVEKLMNRKREAA